MTHNGTWVTFYSDEFNVIVTFSLVAGKTDILSLVEDIVFIKIRFGGPSEEGRTRPIIRMTTFSCLGFRKN